jgi:hypothetical protein
MTWRYVIYDIWQSLKQNFDDGELSLSHVKYWVVMSANRLFMQHIEKRDSGKYLNVFTGLQVQTDSTTGYKYIQLPTDIFDMDGDYGINYVTYSHKVEGDICVPMFTQVQFTRTTPSASRVLYYTQDETPVPENPYWYLQGNRVYLLGIECINVLLEIGIYSTISIDECNIDDDLPFPVELLPILQKYVLDLGRFVLMIPRDMTNDGSFDLKGQEQPTQKIRSVNEDQNNEVAAQRAAQIVMQQMSE